MHLKALLISLLIASSAAAPAPVPLETRQSPVHYEGSYGFIAPMPPCYPPGPNTELVEFSVSYQGHYTYSIDADGVVTYKGHSNSHGTGIGQTSGKKYVLSDTGNYQQTFVFAPPYDSAIRVVYQYRVVKQGSGNIYQYTGHYSYTYDQNNGLVFKFDKSGDSC